jgi:histidine ammonia-lyase
LVEQSHLVAALSAEAYQAKHQPFEALLHSIRPHLGQVESARQMRKWLKDSPFVEEDKFHVQDPYSFRCIPQVHGASINEINHIRQALETEINSVTDNPNIFPDEDLIVSGGNFHGQPLALALDFLSIAMSELANISERRTYQLISGLRNLPAFLVKNPGLNSGFMIPQYTAAGIVSENKQLCTPSSVDSIPSSINQEDHVSMGANGAVKCKRVLDNVEKVLAIELLTAVQAIEFRRPLKSSEQLEQIIVAFRKEVSFNEADRILHNDMMQSVAFLKNYTI